MAQEELSREDSLSRREYLKVTGVAAVASIVAVAGARGVWELLGKSRYELRSGSYTPNLERELLDKLAQVFAPENYWREARLTYGPEIAGEVSFLPSLDSKLDRDVAVELFWSKEILLEERRRNFPAANALVNKQKPHFPRNLPILNNEAFSPFYPVRTGGDYPYLPESITVGGSYRKGEVLRLATRESIITPDVHTELDITWIALSKIGEETPPAELFYMVTSRVPSYTIPVTFRVENGTLFIPSELRILSETDLRPASDPHFPQPGILSA